MSDRTYLQLIVFDCPEDQRAALLTVLVDGVPETDPTHYGTGLDLDGANEWPERDTGRPDPKYVGHPMADGKPLTIWERIQDELVLGHRYGWDEMPLDSYSTLASGIIGVAPLATFQCWVDPKYDYDGETVIYAPDLGEFSGPCTEGGEPYIESQSVRRILREETSSEDKIATLSRALGLPWSERLATLSQALDASEKAVADA